MRLLLFMVVFAAIIWTYLQFYKRSEEAPPRKGVVELEEAATPAASDGAAPEGQAVDEAAGEAAGGDAETASSDEPASQEPPR